MSAVAGTPPQPDGQTWPVSIGVAAQLSGISAKMLRHYEALGLLGAVSRTGSNYRQYGQADVHTLRFIRRARDMGFSLEAITELVSLWHNRRRSSAQVKQIAQKHHDALGQRIQALQAMQRSLQTLLCACPGDERPGCPILDDLGQAPTRAFGRDGAGPQSAHAAQRPTA
ncbi:MAG: Cu(I)-responsive transcriptional regulator [Hydrogenophaga sp.]